MAGEVMNMKLTTNNRRRVHVQIEEMKIYSQRKIDAGGRRSRLLITFNLDAS